MKIHDSRQFKHGMRIKCVIDGIEIEDARLSREYDETWYLYQNENGGSEADESEHKYSWYLGSSWQEEECRITEMYAIEPIYGIKEGDIVVDKDGDQAKVFFCNDYIFIKSYWSDFSTTQSTFYTYEEAIVTGWKPKDYKDNSDKKDELVKKAKEMEKKAKELREEAERL